MRRCRFIWIRLSCLSWLHRNTINNVIFFLKMDKYWFKTRARITRILKVFSNGDHFLCAGLNRIFRSHRWKNITFWHTRWNFLFKSLSFASTNNIFSRLSRFCSAFLLFWIVGELWTRTYIEIVCLNKAFKWNHKTNCGEYASSFWTTLRAGKKKVELQQMGIFWLNTILQKGEKIWCDKSNLHVLMIWKSGLLQR